MEAEDEDGDDRVAAAQTRVSRSADGLRISYRELHYMLTEMQRSDFADGELLDDEGVY